LRSSPYTSSWTWSHAPFPTRTGLESRQPRRCGSSRSDRSCSPPIPYIGLREEADTLHHPYLPAAFSLFPDLTVHRTYNGYWYWGRPTAEELRRDMREITRSLRADWDPA